MEVRTRVVAPLPRSLDLHSESFHVIRSQAGFVAPVDLANHTYRSVKLIHFLASCYGHEVAHEEKSNLLLGARSG